MRRLGLKHIKVGMKVARPILRIDGRVVLGAGMEITEEYLAKLPEQGVTSIYIVDDRLKNVILEDILSDSMRTFALKTAKEINDNLADIYNNQQRRGLKDEAILGLLEDADKKIDKLAKAMVEDFMRIKNPMVNLIDTRMNDEYIYAHMVNVTALAILLGKTLGYKFEKLVDLAKGCLVHDIGIIVGVPPEIRLKSEGLTPEELVIVRKHPEVAFNFLRKIRTLSIMSAHVAYQHHERFNGGGYPRGLKSNEVTEFGYITGICDVYDAITNNKVYKMRVLPDKAREFLMLSIDRFFPENIIIKFLSKVPAYPVGTTVIINNGAYEAVVIKQNDDELGRPWIRIIKEKDIAVNECYDIDLSEKFSFMISKILD